MRQGRIKGKARATGTEPWDTTAFSVRKQRRDLGRCKWRVGDVRGEENHRVGFENQVKKMFQGDISVVNVEASVRLLDVTLPIIGDLPKQFQGSGETCGFRRGKRGLKNNNFEVYLIQSSKRQWKCGKNE